MVVDTSLLFVFDSPVPVERLFCLTPTASPAEALLRAVYSLLHCTTAVTQILLRIRVFLPCIVAVAKEHDGKQNYLG